MLALSAEFVDEITYLADQANPITLRHFDPTPYQDRVPRSLCYLWRTFGVSNWANNCLQFVDPAPYMDLTEALLEGNPFIQSDDVVPYSITAFGTMRVWHRKFGHVNIDFPKSMICFPNEPVAELSGRNREINLTVTIPDKAMGDHCQLLSACLKTFGPINEAEIYGFVPALALGGIADIKHVEKLSAPEHLSMLSQLETFRTYYRDVSTFPGTMVEMKSEAAQRDRRSYLGRVH
jgi:hypothetical protein